MKRFLLVVCALLMAFVFSAAAAESEKYESTEFHVRYNTKYEGKLKSEENGIFFAETNPRRGELLLHENGLFSYTPNQNFKGKDYFGYRVKDAEGNISQEKTAILKIS